MEERPAGLRGVEGELKRNLKLGEAVTDERAGVFTPDKDGGTHTSCGRAAVLAARRGTVCGEVGLGRVPRFCQLTLHTLYRLWLVYFYLRRPQYRTNRVARLPHI